MWQQEVRRATRQKHRIAFLYSVEGTERWHTDRIDKTTGNVTGTMNYVQLTIMVTFIDADSGDRVTVQGIGWGSDTGDKAPYKALTGAIKYCLRMAFVIPDESDPENDKAEVHAEVERQKAQSGPALVSALQGSVAQETAKQAGERRAAEERNKLAQEQGVFSVENDILHCKIVGIQKKQTKPTPTKPAREFLSVTFNGRLSNGANFASVFDTELYEALNAGLDKEVKLKIAIKGAYVNVEDVLWIQGIGGEPGWLKQQSEPLFEGA